jgi:regulator of replication initiation timing
MKNNQNSYVYGIVVTALLLLSAVLGWFFWEKSKNILAEKERIEAERQVLLVQKAAIAHSLDSLSRAYSDLRTENENLQGKVTSSAVVVEQKEAAIQEIRTQAAGTIEELRGQVATLERVKAEYETILTLLREENAQLKDENQRLAGENRQLTGRLAEVGRQLEDQIRKTQSASFKASSFRVEVERRNNKLTTRARPARELQVVFDLADVPTAFQGPQKLYLSITDDQGRPIRSANPAQTMIQAPSGPINIFAHQVKPVDLETTQRLSFTYKFDDRLRAGVYVVAIYCDQGLLGVHSFRLI